MRRRDALRRTGTLGLVALAGCLGGGDPDTDDDEPTDTAALTDRSFEATGVGSGEETQTATVAFGDPVTVTGTTTGNNGCYTAVLASADYDGTELAVTVRAAEREDAEGCTEALVEVDYEATFTFAGGGPERVVVEHDSLGEVHAAAEAERSG